MTSNPLDAFTTTLSFIRSTFKYVKRWWKFRLPASQILGEIVDNKTLVKIFLKDFIVPNNTLASPKLISFEGNNSQMNPNIEKVWAEAESEGLTDLTNLLGRLDKHSNIEVGL
jgi:hypothetical protein